MTYLSFDFILTCGERTEIFTFHAGASLIKKIGSILFPFLIFLYIDENSLHFFEANFLSLLLTFCKILKYFVSVIFFPASISFKNFTWGDDSKDKLFESLKKYGMSFFLIPIFNFE